MKGQIIELQKATGNVYLETIADFKNVTKSKDVESNCISINFVNKGSNTVVVNGLKIAENQSFQISQPSACIDRTIYQVSFDSDGATSDLVIIRILPKNQS